MQFIYCDHSGVCFPARLKEFDIESLCSAEMTYSPKVRAAATEDDLVGIELNVTHLDHHVTQFSLQTEFS